MTQCPHCGATSFYPSGPHSSGTCPFLKEEFDLRMEILKTRLARERALMVRAERRVVGQGVIHVEH